MKIGRVYDYIKKNPEQTVGQICNGMDDYYPEVVRCVRDLVKMECVIIKDKKCSVNIKSKGIVTRNCFVLPEIIGDVYLKLRKDLMIRNCASCDFDCNNLTGEGDVCSIKVDLDKYNILEEYK